VRYDVAGACACPSGGDSYLDPYQTRGLRLVRPPIVHTPPRRPRARPVCHPTFRVYLYIVLYTCTVKNRKKNTRAQDRVTRARKRIWNRTTALCFSDTIFRNVRQRTDHVNPHEQRPCNSVRNNDIFFLTKYTKYVGRRVRSNRIKPSGDSDLLIAFCFVF